MGTSWCFWNITLSTRSMRGVDGGSSEEALEGVDTRETSTHWHWLEDSPDISFNPKIANRSSDTSRSEHKNQKKISLWAHADISPQNNFTDFSPLINIFPSGSNEFELHLSENNPPFQHLSCERAFPEAVISAKGKIMMFLMPVKQDVNIKVENDIVCLQFASQRGRSELVEELLQPGRNYHDCVAVDDNLNDSQAHIVIQNSYPHFSRSFSEACGFSADGVSTIHPELEYCVRMYTHRSCFSDDSDTFTEMLKVAQLLGLLSVNAQDTNGNTILHEAVYKGHKDLVKKLLKCGSFISTLNYSSQTPIQLAQNLNDVQILNLLDSHISSFPMTWPIINSGGIDEIEKLINKQIEICDQYDEVVRLQGIFKGPEPCISREFNSEVYQTKLKKLLDWVSSGNPLVQPGCINTFILHKASSEGLAIGLHSLLAAGASLWSPICNQSLIQLSFKSPDNPTLATFILAKALEDRLVAEMSFDPMDDLDNKLKSGIKLLVEKLRGKTPWLAQYPNKCGSDEMTELLLRACSHGATNAAWWLSHAGANTNSIDTSTGKRALQSALMNEKYDTATDLIRYMGANPFVPDSSGQLPIELFPEEQRANIYRTLKDRLVAEMSFEPKDDLDNKLKSGVKLLVEKLRGKTPCLAQYPNECGSDEMTELLVRACSHGATNAAWWLRHAGANTNSIDRSTGIRALQSALMNEKYDTATDLIRYMGANPFVPDSSGQLPIELFPEEQRANIYRGCLAEESSRLKRLCAKFRYRHNIWNDVKGLILLLSVLYITLLRRATIPRDNIEEFYVSSLELMDTTKVMEGFDSDYGNSKAFWSLMSTLLQKIYKPRLKTLENKSFFNQLYLKGLQFSRYIEENLDPKLSFDSVLLDAFKMCSEKRFPLFLHLIVSVGRVDINANINEECRTTALHHAAANGNMSALSYLISKGAVLLAKDKYGRSPLHYASFYGHKITQKFLESKYGDDKGIQCSSGRSAADYSEAYRTCLETCGVEVNSSAAKYSCEYLQIRYHLQKIETLWKAKGIIDATREVTVDYKKGEAACIKKAVEESMKNLMSVVASQESTFEGELELLGSSAEGVRLFLPDEFDFNWILTNKSGFQRGDLKVKLENSPFRGMGADRKFTILSDKEDCMKWEYGGILREFMTACKKCLVGFEFSDKRLSLVPPGVKYKMVGLGLTMMWTGKHYPLLFIDVDIVPTIKAPWPEDLNCAPLLPENVNVIYLSTSVDGGWRLSNGIVERTILEKLHGMRKVVFIACKMLLSALKVPGWVPADIKNQYRYFADGYQRIRCPNGFVLKSCFFRELQEMKDDSHWLKDNVVERVISIFRRMCEEEKANPPTGENSYAGKVFSYFGESTAEPISANGAPEILRFLEFNKYFLKKMLEGTVYLDLEQKHIL